MNIENPDQENPQSQPEQQVGAAPPHSSPAASPEPNAPKSSNKKRRVIFALALLLIVAVALAWYFANKSTPTTPKQSANTVSAKQVTIQTEPHLVFVNDVAKTIVVANKNLQQSYSVSYSAAPYASFTSSSPSGDLLFFLSKSVSDSSQQYMLVDKTGKQQTISPDAQKVLASANGDRGTATVYLRSAKEAVLTTCTYQASTKDNKCSLLLLDLQTGSTQNILSAVAPIATDTGDALFALKGLTSDRKTAFLEVSGPTDLGSSQDGVYSVDLNSKKVKTVLKLPETNLNVTSVSPSGKKLVYVTGGENAPTTIHLLNTISGKDTVIDNKNRNFVEDSNLWAWSPDENKLLFYSYQPGTPEPSYGPVSYSYLDITKGTLNDTQTITDTAHKLVDYQAWLDNDTIAYDFVTTTNPHNFSDSSPQIFKQSITDNKQSLQNVTYGRLSHIVYY